MKKRLLLITWGFPFGESERSFLTEEFAALAERFEVNILTANTQDALIYPTPGVHRVERLAFSPLHQQRDLRTALFLMRPHILGELLCALGNCSPPNWGNSCAELLSYAHHVRQAMIRIRTLVSQEHIDLVYSYWCAPFAVAALWLKREFPFLQVVIRFHGADLYTERTKLGWQPFRNDVTAQANRLVFACDRGRDYYLAHWGQQAASKSRVAYLGSREVVPILGEKQAKERFFNTRLQPLRLISCANLIPLKRVHLIMEAISLLPPELVIEWHHIGAGFELEPLLHQASAQLSNRLNIRYKFWGAVPNHMLGQLYQQVQPHVFITTSSTEGGVPVSIQEAFSMGLPAIGTAVGGIPEIILDGKTGILLPADPSAEEVAAAISCFAAYSAEKKAALGDKAKELWAEKFNAKKNAEKFVDMLEELCLN